MTWLWTSLIVIGILMIGAAVVPNVWRRGKSGPPAAGADRTEDDGQPAADERKAEGV
jgi:hypothetical protein